MSGGGLCCRYSAFRISDVVTVSVYSLKTGTIVVVAAKRRTQPGITC